MKTAHTQSGYTLLELLLYIAIVAPLLLGVSVFFAGVETSRIKNQSIAEVHEQARHVTDYVTFMIRNSTGITSPTPGNSSASLTLAMPLSAQNPTVINLSSGALRATEGATSAVPLTSSGVTVSGLTFTNMSYAGTPGVVRVTFTLATNSPGNNAYQYQRTFTTSAESRW